MDETQIVILQLKVSTRVLPASANVSYAACVDDIDLVLLTLAKKELCSEITISCIATEQVGLACRL